MLYVWLLEGIHICVWVSSVDIRKVNVTSTSTARRDTPGASLQPKPPRYSPSQTPIPTTLTTTTTTPSFNTHHSPPLPPSKASPPTHHLPPHNSFFQKTRNPSLTPKPLPISYPIPNPTDSLSRAHSAPLPHARVVVAQLGLGAGHAHCARWQGQYLSGMVRRAQCALSVVQANTANTVNTDEIPLNVVQVRASTLKDRRGHTCSVRMCSPCSLFPSHLHHTHSFRTFIFFFCFFFSVCAVVMLPHASFVPAGAPPVQLLTTAATCTPAATPTATTRPPLRLTALNTTNTTSTPTTPSIPRPHLPPRPHPRPQLPPPTGVTTHTPALELTDRGCKRTHTLPDPLPRERTHRHRHEHEHVRQRHDSRCKTQSHNAVPPQYSTITPTRIVYLTLSPPYLLTPSPISTTHPSIHPSSIPPCPLSEYPE
ncbi:hypothetical protein K439DRAFT_873159 [Ramaria rubella]|nr:hypothetical protein K439DRAFT_873159 [Ramaria rubella]